MDQHRLEKCNKLRKMGLNPYVNSHIISSPISDILERFSKEDDVLPENEELVKKMMFFLKMKNLVQQEEFLLKESLEKQLF